ncbi:Glu-tRNA(Gln) amidotransferase subunit GatE [Methanobrevibacter boviskoreani]|uniref:Glu-tRNA(Gln) amidotransferase subunit GatE n=1 Tax=Methanobrevibacter boviskoreani TaxID=1348249 RepID=UPI0023A90C2A|nr:Glu-tRNA(Gln) amidotransferase subunit GatE [Methanobrevibacter boviskoreani]MCI6774910.1 Glu-tRNA(Gln) amidotransferase subunit GatE [Methanobrevibacter boviskoreani]MDD6257349.1 Glu-tRNA(Gln) amidotransferase subunit GatE [Methanobrevibacter boviskoreani]MDY5613795.1 Glu-tRNA(Gln) amidotransferase subunit GatE [Methanobrevibacter boviskoreani]
MSEKYDWKDLGLKMGLEIHQQLNTKSKLFCSCPTELVDDDVDLTIRRNLRPTQSELGQMDRAALQESMRNLNFNYESFNKHTCLVECDDEPPHALNQEALELAITISTLLNMHIVDEFHTMRKQVIDGSNTSGFQRTGLLATDGYLDTPYGRVKIETIGLEEDAARRVDTNSEFTEFRLDRLGIPLVEITTDPSMHHPKQVEEVAYMIGQVLRSTNVKRGLGTIRQDLNVSIAKGARVEIKGVQNLELMPLIVEREVERQLKLIEIKEELEKRHAEVDETIYDLDEVFKDTESKILKSAKSIKGIILKGFDGLIGVEVQEGRRFGTELSSYAKKRGVSGLFHTDELPAYGITQEEVDNLREFLDAKPEDAIIIVAHDPDIAESALEEVIRRAKLAFEGVVEETRKSLDDGNTEYMRPLATANRMYLETDIPLFKITDEIIEPIKNNLPELPDVKKERIIKEYNLSEDLASQIVRRALGDEFENILKEVEVDPTVVASTLSYDLRDIRREGTDVVSITEDKLIEVFKLLEANKISKDAIKKLIESMCKNPDKSAEVVAEENNLSLLSLDDVKAIIEEIADKNDSMIKERQMGAMGPLMGMSMKQLKGKADGSTVNKIVKEEIQKRL